MEIQPTTELASPNATDTADFAQRMSVYGMGVSGVIQSDLVVPPKTTLTLSAGDTRSFLRPRLLTTTDLDELKAWIGLPDTLYTNKKLDMGTIRLPTSPAPTHLVEEAADVTARLPVVLPVEQVTNLRTAASAYLFGNSQLVAGYKSAIEKFYPNFQIIFWPFVTVTVNAGSTLVIGAGQNVLCAWRIVIYQGGRVVGEGGSLKVDSSILQKI
jgi:hypothetical protein